MDCPLGAELDISKTLRGEEQVEEGISKDCEVRNCDFTTPDIRQNIRSWDEILEDLEENEQPKEKSADTDEGKKQKSYSG